MNLGIDSEVFVISNVSLNESRRGVDSDDVPSNILFNKMAL